jgi:hypothetical protein
VSIQDFYFKECLAATTFPLVMPPASRTPAKVSLCQTGVAT